ncbi:Hypothetical protein HVR_LOCUS1001 [uncultured virus]|nr:Hypothetical protein HVR_LOCUS1001 [uncultured virus]
MTEFIRFPKENLEVYEKYFPEWNFNFTVGDRSIICPKCYVDAIIGDKTITWNRCDVQRWNQQGFPN